MSTPATANAATAQETVKTQIVSINAVAAGGKIYSTSPTLGVGYGTGAGSTVTQLSSRTTGVTIDAICGRITLYSTAGSTTAASFTVTNAAMVAGDVVILNQYSGTDKYDLSVTASATGSFEITSRTYSGTTSEAPVFSFAIIKAVVA